MSDLFGKDRIFTMPDGSDFMTGLAAGLDHLESAQGFDAADITIYLPNQRSIRAFQAHLMKTSGGTPRVLPNLRPIGGADEDDILLGALEVLDEDLHLPPPITPMARIFYLQDEIKKLAKSGGLFDFSPPQRLMLAKELGLLLDQMQNTGVSLEKLEDLAPEDYAEHWKEVLAFLKIISKTWPDKLAGMGLMDPVARRKKLIEAQIKTWQAAPPEAPVIAAGSTGSVPMTQALLKAITQLPKGLVIFPGLDKTMDLEAWEEIEETHPQFAMAKTLEALKTHRQKVPDWPFANKLEPTTETRLGFFKKALLPAPATTRWYHQKFKPTEVMKSFGVIETETTRVEAGVIALLMRQTLETPEKTAALVTPDRDLASRVKSELKRWNIHIDDSAGVALSTTPPGAFFNLLVEMAGGGFSPVALLGFLKHPLTTLGMDRQRLLAHARTLDKRILRGVAPGGGLKGIERQAKYKAPEKEREEIFNLLKTLDAATNSLAKGLQKKTTSFEDLLKAHIGAASELSKAGEEPGLWRGVDGEHLSGFLDRLLDVAPAMGKISGADYPRILQTLMMGERVRRPFSLHPRLFIWGTLEARLQRPDLVILSGLNEGTWPPDAKADPWMSRDMRKALGLPTPDFRVGQSAHDFTATAGAPEVIMTRSIKIEGTPATKSRWLQRAEALLAGELPRARGGEWVNWFEALDQPKDSIVLNPPSPKPKAAVRPGNLSVTNVEKLMQDPYAIFAKYILRLSPLNELEADPGAADKGSLLHKIFEVFFKEHNNALPPEPLDALFKTAAKEFDNSGYARPAIRAFWWPRFRQTAKAFIAYQKGRELEAKTLDVEVKGAFKAPGDAGFEVTATADRLDQNLEDGTLRIIDYKSGQIPTGPQMMQGKKPQLPLEALMAEAGGFKNLPKAKVAALEFWNVGSPELLLDVKDPVKPKDIDACLEAAREGLNTLVSHFADENNPYLAVPDPSGHRFGDYDPLSRYQEWQNRPLNKGGEK